MKRIFFCVIAGLILNGCSQVNTVKQLPASAGHHVVSQNGMVVSAHPQGSAIGVLILQMGGNAVDAAVATGFALAVCYPAAGNIGGGGFMVIRLASGETDVIDYREKAPAEAERDMYLDKAGSVIAGLSTDSHLAAGVPGAVDGMLKVHSKYGRLALSEVLQPAIDLASEGFILTSEQAASLNHNREIFISRNKRTTAFVCENLWEAGDTLKQPELAETLGRIRDHGRDGFYGGKTAELIVNEMQNGGGLITATDLRDYESVFRSPLVTVYKGYKFITVPPPSGGGLVLFQVLGMIEPMPIREWGFNSPSAVHAIVEAERRAFADRAEYSGDPDFTDVPVRGMTNRKYLASRMSDYNENMATRSEEISAGFPPQEESSETTHYSVVDIDGNAVAVTTTLNNSYGNSIVVGGAGFLLNDEMDDFSIKPGVPNMYGLIGGEANSVQPAKRMLSSMTPVIVEKDGKLFIVAGSPGGSTIPTTVFQVLINVIDYNMDIGAAVDTGRFHHQWLPDWISYEPSRLDSMMVSKLKEMGHSLRKVGALGRVNAIQMLQDGRIYGAADRRGDNSACGY